MKRIAIISTIAVLFAFFCIGCDGSSNEPSPTATPIIETETPTNTLTSTPTEVPTPTASPELIDITIEDLIKLTKENGTGEIPFGMKFDEIIEKLKKYNIKYKVNPDSICVIQGEKVFFYDFSDDGNGIMILTQLFALPETERGLKDGDSYKKMVELYGDNYRLVWSKSGEKYYYYYLDNVIIEFLGVEHDGYVKFDE